MLPKCNSRFVQRGDDEQPYECPGHLGKFGSCVDEALYTWSLDQTEDSCGDTDFEGHLTVVIVYADEVFGLGQTDEADEREVIVPAGNYLVWTASTGQVSVSKVGSVGEAREIFERAQTRHALWGAGCNPDDPQGHEDCGDFCRKREWVNA